MALLSFYNTHTLISPNRWFQSWVHSTTVSLYCNPCLRMQIQYINKVFLLIITAQASPYKSFKDADTSWQTWCLVYRWRCIMSTINIHGRNRHLKYDHQRYFLWHFLIFGLFPLEYLVSEYSLWHTRIYTTHLGPLFVPVWPVDPEKYLDIVRSLMPDAL